MQNLAQEERKWAAENGLASAPMAWVVTDSQGTIVDISPHVAKLLNVSARHLRGRNLLVFVVEGRSRLTRELRWLPEGYVCTQTAVFMPREKRRFSASLEIVSVRGTTPFVRDVYEWSIHTQAAA